MLSKDCDNTWHSAVVWEGKNAPDLMEITRGKTVHLTGRIRQNRYMAADGTEKQVSEIYVNKLDIIEEQITAQCSF